VVQSNPGFIVPRVTTTFNTPTHGTFYGPIPGDEVVVSGTTNNLDGVYVLGANTSTTPGYTVISNYYLVKKGGSTGVTFDNTDSLIIKWKIGRVVGGFSMGQNFIIPAGVTKVIQILGTSYADS
jgi:hypothetical protein